MTTCSPVLQHSGTGRAQKPIHPLAPALATLGLLSILLTLIIMNSSMS